MKTPEQERVDGLTDDEKRCAADSGWADEMYEGLLRMACRTMHIDFDRRYTIERGDHLPRDEQG